MNTDNTKQDIKTLEGKYLSFHLGDEVYGIEILKVREIIGLMDITALPDMHDYVKGVINLRGKVIPVVDLRLKFGMEEKESNERTCIIVVEVQTQAASTLAGMLVDAVAEVTTEKAEDIEPPPDLGATAGSGYILGMAKNDGQVKILIDIDKILGTEELTRLAQAA